ncbi:MAG TPA: sigma-70 family RNA polymerase sigma factor [Allocoleopsis sp.]
MADASGLNSLLAPAPELVNPASATDSGYITDVANSYLQQGLTADQAMEKLSNADLNMNNFAAVYDPKTNKFVPKATTQPTGLPGLNALVAEQVLTSAPTTTPATTSPTIEPGGLVDLAMHVPQTLWDWGKTAASDVKTEALADAGAIANWNQTHATNAATPLQQQDLESAQLMGLLPKGLTAAQVQKYPASVAINDPNGEGYLHYQPGVGITVGSTTKMSPNQIHDMATKYVKAHGGDLTAMERRIAQSNDPNSPAFDPAALLVGDNPIIDNLSNPAVRRTVLQNNIKLVTQARSVLANPTQYSKEQIEHAKNLVDFWQDKAKGSLLDDTKSFVKMAVNNPIGTAKTLVGSIAQNPALLFAPGGDLGFGAKAAEAASTAGRAARMARIGLGAGAEGADGLAGDLAATAGRRGAQYADIANNAAKAAAKLRLASKAARIGTNAAVGAGINTAMSKAQQENQTGVASNLGGAAVQGAIMGGVLAALHGGPDVKLTDGSLDTRAPGEQIPGEPLPASTPKDTAHDVTYTGGVNSNLGVIHLDKDTPTSLTITNRIGQPVTINPHDTIGYHERVEAALMHPQGPIGQDGLLKVIQRMGANVTKDNLPPEVAKKIAEGIPLSYQEAHEIAQASEHAMIESQYDIDPSQYDKALKPYIQKAANKSKAKTGVQPNTPPGLDTKPYDDMGHPEEAGPGGVSGGPTGETGGPNASNPQANAAVDKINPRTGLPISLGAPKPRFGSHQLKFEDPVDLALYITANASTKSAAHAKFLAYLARHGYTGDLLKEAQLHIKQRVKSLGMSAEDKALVTIPKNAPVEAGFLSRNKNRLAAMGIASGIGSLAASTLNQPNDPWQKKLERAAIGSGLGILATLDRYGRPAEPRMGGASEAGFIGRNAEHGWSPTEEGLAIKAAREGATPTEIHAAYGLIRDPEGNWMKEATDRDMHYVNSHVVRNAIQKEVPLNDFIQGSAFQKAYPKLASDVKVTVEPSSSKGFWGTYDPKKNLITLYPHYGADDLGQHWLGVLSHELQHIVQKHEGWPEGAVPANFIDQAKRNLGEGADPLAIKKEARRLYHTVYGEEVAEIARHSRTMSDEELRQSFPIFQTPEGERILKHGSRYMQGMTEPEESLSDHLKKSGDVTEDGDVPSLKETGNIMPNESEFVARAAKGDQRAVASLYNHYVPIITRTIGKMLLKNNKPFVGPRLGLTAEDIANEAFHRAISAVQSGDFAGRSHLYTYLHSIARNLSMNALRDAGRQPETTSLYRPGTVSSEVTSPLSGEVGIGSHNDLGKPTSNVAPEVEQLSSQEPTPLESLEGLEEQSRSQQVSDALHEAMASLPADLRQHIIDHDLNGMSFTDMAKRDGVTEGAVRARVNRAQTALKYAMQHGSGAKFLKQGGFATPKALTDLFRFGVIPFVGATIGMAEADPDHKLKGALMGAIAGLLVGRLKLVDTYKNIRMVMQHPDTPDISILTSGYEGIKAGVQRDAYQVKRKIEELVPNAKRRQELTHILEGTSKSPLTPQEAQAIKLAKEYYQRIGNAGLAKNVLKKLLPNFVNHEWLSDKGDWTRHNLNRTYKTYQEGLDAGRIPRSLDLADLVHMYGRDMASAMASKHLFDGLRTMPLDLEGHMGIMDATKAPRNYVQFDHPMFFGKAVNPKIAAPLRFVYQNPMGDTMRALTVLNSTVKNSKLGGSLFHPFTLGLVHLATHPWFSHGGILGAVKEIAQSTVGKTEMQRMYREGGYGDDVHKVMAGGLGITHPGHGELVDQDVRGLAEGLNTLENWIRQYPILGAPAGKVVRGVSKAYHLENKFVWENIHTGVKLQTAVSYLNTLRMNWLRAAAKDPTIKVPSDMELARQAANATNDLYGGLNWRQTVEDAKTKWGRALAVAVNDPSVRNVAQLAVFALDWTESTLRSFLGSFGKGSGVSGLIHPKYAADLYRQYTLRNAVMIGIIYNAINMATVGHPIWDNKDPNGNPEPFSIQLPNGDTIQPNKHFFEGPNLVMDTFKPIWEPGASPFQWEMNKLGQIPQEAIDQGFGIEYVNPNAPKIGNRFIHALKQFEPISVESTKQKQGWDNLLTMFMQVSHHNLHTKRRHSRAKEAANINSMIGGQ